MSVAKIKKAFFLLCIFFFLIIVRFSYVQAQTETSTPTPSLTPTPTSNNNDNSEKLSDLQKQIKELEAKISVVQIQKRTLSSQITVMDNQIRLTQLRINATKEEILQLSKDIQKTNIKISKLEKALTGLTKVLLNRIIVTYQVGSVEPFHVLLYSSDISDFFTRANYLKVVQNHDKKLIYETEQAKNDYANQKNIFETKKKKVEVLKNQLEAYTLQLDQEKAGKKQLLEITNNDEKNYQEMLARARAEYEAIQGIVAGKGDETEAGFVSEGVKIATVISGSSCNSDGTHLHFIVSKGGNTESPFNYLKGDIDYENCSGSSCGSGDGDPFNPSGSWNWPLDPKIKMNQGYGSTWATRYTWVGRIYNFHNGIDIQGSSLDVKAVKSGKLYQGSYAGYAGCRLRYVKVVQDDGFETFYLHVNYVF